MPATTYSITFLRHGESVGNAEDRFQGHADFPLTEKGRRQANTLAEIWKKENRHFDRCFASPLLRARETAEIICNLLGVPISFVQDWKEIDNGLIAGLNAAEAEQVAPRPAVITPYTHYGKTGESVWELYLRSGRALQQVLDQPPGIYLVTAHGGILNMAISAILGIPLQIEPSGPRFLFKNTTHATFSYDPGHHRWELIEFKSG
jgi:2,3-bisphosphoglycerate-dependent phosphoglycerate mutase